MRGSCRWEQLTVGGTSLLSLRLQRRSLASGPTGISLTEEGSFTCTDLMRAHRQDFRRLRNSITTLLS